MMDTKCLSQAYLMETWPSLGCVRETKRIAGADVWFSAARITVDKAVEDDTIQDQSCGSAKTANSQTELNIM